MKQFLIISNMYPKDEQDFFGVFIKNIKIGLEKQGFKVDVIAICGRGKGLIDKLLKYLKFYFEILKADFNKYDFVQVSYPSHSFLPVLFKRRGKAKLIVRFHGSDFFPTSFESVITLINKKSIEEADMVVVPSNYFYETISSLSTPRKHHIYPSGGLDTAKFYPIQMEKNKFVIGHVGRLDRGKGVDILIRAVEHLNFDFELHIIGSGSMEKELKMLAERSVKKDKIIFFGKIANHELVNYYNKFDIFVFPTTRKAESFGNVAIEAMACKVPLIGSNIPPLTEYIFDGKNGFLFEPNDVDDLNKKINHFFLLSDSEKEAMEETSLKVAMNYEMERVNKLFVSSLNSLVR